MLSSASVELLNFLYKMNDIAVNGDAEKGIIERIERFVSELWTFSLFEPIVA